MAKQCPLEGRPAVLPENLSLDPATTGYGEAADALASQYESIRFEDVHRDVLHLFPQPPARVLDVGAGTGRDAAALARRGHAVVAVEPTAALRAHGRRIHRDVPIDWVDDTLPSLRIVRARNERFGLILVTAVWMHLDAQERTAAMSELAALLDSQGVLSMSLRHGPVPAGRRMFEVSADETASLAVRFSLVRRHVGAREDMLGRQDVNWTFLVFGRR